MNWRDRRIEEYKQWAERHGRVHTTTVAGYEFKYWSDTTYRCTFAESEDLPDAGILKIHSNGYITNDLTVRKAIATTFELVTFRK